MEHHSAVLLRRLNPYCARALEAAASLCCQTRAHASILPEHWLLKLLELGEGDMTVIARRYEWDMEAIWQDLLNFLERLRVPCAVVLSCRTGWKNCSGRRGCMLPWRRIPKSGAFIC